VAAAQYAVALLGTQMQRKTMQEVKAMLQAMTFCCERVHEVDTCCRTVRISQQSTAGNVRHVRVCLALNVRNKVCCCNDRITRCLILEGMLPICCSPVGK
jgi:hypothetical protein